MEEHGGGDGHGAKVVGMVCVGAWWGFMWGLWA